MADNRKCSAPSTSEQFESEEQDDYNVKRFVQWELTKVEIKSEPTNNHKFFLQ